MKKYNSYKEVLLKKFGNIDFWNKEEKRYFQEVGYNQGYILPSQIEESRYISKTINSLSDSEWQRLYNEGVRLHGMLYGRYIYIYYKGVLQLLNVRDDRVDIIDSDNKQILYSLSRDKNISYYIVNYCNVSKLYNIIACDSIKQVEYTCLTWLEALQVGRSLREGGYRYIR